MDLHPTPFPGKNQKNSRTKTINKASEPRKINVKEPPILRQKRVFGTIQNPNLPSKTAIGKPVTKISSGVVQKPTKISYTTQTPTEAATTIHETKTDTKDEKNVIKPKKKSVCFHEKIVPGKDNSTGLKTPVRKSPDVAKPRVSGTPYISAEKCSKCRFDKLETSSYWLAQIKLAESVKKHSVSASFFRLALESKAEPYRNIRVELKKYLARHEHLSSDKEWIDVSSSYGLMKEVSKIELENSHAITNEEVDPNCDEEHETKDQVDEDNESKELVDL